MKSMFHSGGGLNQNVYLSGNKAKMPVENGGINQLISDPLEIW